MEEFTWTDPKPKPKPRHSFKSEASQRLIQSNKALYDKVFKHKFKDIFSSIQENKNNIGTRALSFKEFKK